MDILLLKEASRHFCLGVDIQVMLKYLFEDLNQIVEKVVHVIKKY